MSRFRLVRARRPRSRPVRGPSSVRRPSSRPSSLWPSARGFGLLAAGLVVLGIVAWIVYGTSMLGVREIAVDGATIIDVGQVRTAAAVPLGTPLARVDTGAVATRVGRLAPVASVDVSRSWPGTLVIHVTERVPVVSVATPTGFVLLDASGVAFRTVAVAPPGLVALKVTAPGPVDPATMAALHVLAALTPQLRAQLTAVSAASPSTIRLELTDGRVVVWGGADQSDVKARVATALLGRPGKTIDVSAPEVATTS